MENWFSSAAGQGEALKLISKSDSVSENKRQCEQVPALAPTFGYFSDGWAKRGAYVSFVFPVTENKKNPISSKYVTGREIKCYTFM